MVSDDTIPSWVKNNSIDSLEAMIESPNDNNEKMRDDSMKENCDELGTSRLESPEPRTIKDNRLESPQRCGNTDIRYHNNMNERTNDEDMSDEMESQTLDQSRLI